jgi:hypothetical protein
MVWGLPACQGLGAQPCPALEWEPGMAGLVLALPWVMERLALASKAAELQMSRHREAPQSADPLMARQAGRRWLVFGPREALASLAGLLKASPAVRPRVDPGPGTVGRMPAAGRAAGPALVQSDREALAVLTVSRRTAPVGDLFLPGRPAAPAPWPGLHLQGQQSRAVARLGRESERRERLSGRRWAPAAARRARRPPGRQPPAGHLRVPA